MYQGELSDEILSALEANFASLSEREELLDYSAAEYRRAYKLAQFNIVKASALALPLLQHVKCRQAYLPLYDLPMDLNDKLKEQLEAIPRMEKNPQEAAVLAYFWDRLFAAIFNRSACPKLILHAEYNLKSLHENYSHKIMIADRVISVELADGFCLPLLFIEASKDPVGSLALAHKDETKLAQMMACALKATLAFAKDWSIDTLSSCFVYGLLLAGDEMEIMVMRPVVYDRVEGKIHAEFVLSSCRSSWRTNLFLEPGAPQPPPMFDNSSMCRGNEAVVKLHIPNQPFEIPIKPPNHAQHLRNVSEGFNRRLSEGSVNNICLGMLQQVKELLLQQVSNLAGLVSSPEDPDAAFPPEAIRCFQSGTSSHTQSTPLKNFPPSRRLFQAPPDQIPENLLSSKASTSSDFWEKPASVDFRKYCQGSRFMNDDLYRDERTKYLTEEGKIDLKYIEHFDITKKLTRIGYELDVYHLPEIINSVFFPKLFRYNCSEDEGTVQLRLEKILAIREYFEVEKCIMSLDNLQSLSASMLMDGVGALMTLHAAGFVHGDVSINNVGWNDRLKVWQLFDFNQARPIAEACSEVRHGGTDHYRSQAYEKTGLFYPIDDYVSLFNTCTLDFYQISRQNVHFMKPFLKLETMLLSFEDNRSEADLHAIQKEALRIFERINVRFRSRDWLVASPSYRAVLTSIIRREEAAKEADKENREINL